MRRRERRSRKRCNSSVFRELADLLLQRAAAATDVAAAQRDLMEVRSTLEQLRQAEVAEYFRDDCVVQTQGATQLDIETAFPTTKLQDSTFQKATVEREVSGGQYSIVHFATHGHFDSDHSRSFLVTFDGQITIDDLQGSVGQRRYREEAVELLVLSACQTAAGDDRAALGLAGVGLRAGARSVVASLWSISDESTSLPVGELYRRLKDTATTKAQALRAAQLALLGQAKFHHPYFWAPFLLIGNWL